VSSSSWKNTAFEALSVFARWALGCEFIYMGLNKALHPVEFLKLVHQYELVSNPFLLNSIAAALPWFELYCGLLLVVGVAVRGSALVALGMLIPFTSIVLRRGLAIAGAEGLRFCAVKFDCGCGNGEVFLCHKLAENSGLILLAAFLLASSSRRFCLRFSLRNGEGRTGMKQEEWRMGPTK
jgi:uncharacterized membrane protein YphA (DoxX/SURF4 family)